MYREEFLLQHQNYLKRQNVKQYSASVVPKEYCENLIVLDESQREMITCTYIFIMSLLIYSDHYLLLLGPSLPLLVIYM